MSATAGTMKLRLESATKRVLQPSTRRGITGIIVFLLLWQIGSSWHAWFGYSLPWIGAVPAPSAVFRTWSTLVDKGGYWISWYQSTARVFVGFIAAMIVGIPLGLLMATSQTVYRITFPVFETLRPIPPLAWVPASIIFWPTQELSIDFVTFLGAFFTIVINVIDGARSIDIRYFQSARSMGSSKWDIFRRIILPGTLPSIVVGAEVGMGITWAVVVAAEMISGGGGGGGSGSALSGGLGFFTWNSYVGGATNEIVVGMISIGIAGYISSTFIRWIGKRVTPWRRSR